MCSKFLLITSFLSLAFFSQAQEKNINNLTIGGAIRINYLLKSWDDENFNKGGEFAYDMMRLNFDATFDKVIASGEIRFYSNAFGGILIHHAYMGYRFNDSSEIHIGISQVPFGIQSYASNNWFFNVNYYVGLEDDYDLGVKYFTQNEWLRLDVAFYKNSEFPSDNFSRYSYDITGTHHEVNQLNLKGSFKTNHIEIGSSFQVGQLEEIATNDLGSHWASAIHLQGNYGKINIKLQSSYFKLNPRGPEKNFVYMSAYGAEYQTSTEAISYTAGIKFTFSFDKGPIKSIDLYDDFGMVDKKRMGHSNSMMNVLGTGVNMGKMYTYVDWALGKNHSWLGPEWTTAFSSGNANASWHARFNINFGYYF